MKTEKIESTSDDSKTSQPHRSQEGKDRWEPGEEEEENEYELKIAHEEQFKSGEYLKLVRLTKDMEDLEDVMTEEVRESYTGNLANSETDDLAL